jgi:ribonuclease J
LASKLKIIPLGGVAEIGKNMTAIEYGKDIIVIDCGSTFPSDEMLGIDLVIPDTTYLEKNVDRIRGILITHGHEDHIGALPFVLPKLNIPIYGSRLSLALINYKLEEQNIDNATLNCVSAGDVIKLGCFTIEFIKSATPSQAFLGLRLQRRQALLSTRAISRWTIRRWTVSRSTLRALPNTVLRACWR